VGTRPPWTTTEEATTTMMTAYSREASGTPALSRKLPSRIGTAPLSPAHRTQKGRRGRDPDPFADPVGKHRRSHGDANNQHEQREVFDIAHGRAPISKCRISDPPVGLPQRLGIRSTCTVVQPWRNQAGRSGAADCQSGDSTASGGGHRLGCLHSCGNTSRPRPALALPSDLVSDAL
jgi:hypothetical protein